MTAWHDAEELLITATSSTDRVLLAWAVGAYQVTHCQDLARYRRSRNPKDLGREYSGGTGGGLWYENTRKGFEGTVTATGYEFAMAWREVAAVLARVVDDPGMAAEQHELLAERKALVGEGQDLFDRWQRGGRDTPTWEEREAHAERWSSIERRCYTAACRMWEACRPAGVQLGLFDVA